MTRVWWLVATALLAGCGSNDDEETGYRAGTLGSQCQEVGTVMKSKVEACGYSAEPGFLENFVEACCKDACTRSAGGSVSQCIHDMSAASCQSMFPSSSQLDLPESCIGAVHR